MPEGSWTFGMEPDGGSPEEMREAIQKQVDQQVMSEQSFHHDIARLWRELKPDQLVTLKNLLNRMSRVDEPAPALAYYTGVINTVLDVVHGVCSSCGVNHDEIVPLTPEEAAKAFGLGNDEATREMLARRRSEMEVPEPERGSPIDKMIKEFGPPFEPVNQAEWDANLKKYNLRLPRENEVASGEGDMPVICKGCGMLYQSLEDRMLRPTGIDGCGGCQHKSAHG